MTMWLLIILLFLNFYMLTSWLIIADYFLLVDYRLVDDSPTIKYIFPTEKA